MKQMLRLPLICTSVSARHFAVTARPQFYDIPSPPVAKSVRPRDLVKLVGPPALVKVSKRPLAEPMSKVDQKRWGKVTALLFYEKKPLPDMHLTPKTVINWLKAVVPRRTMNKGRKDAALRGRELKRILLTFDPKTTKIHPNLMKKLGFAFSRLGFDLQDPHIPKTKLRAIRTVDLESDFTTDSVSKRLERLGLKAKRPNKRGRQEWRTLDPIIANGIQRTDTVDLEADGVVFKYNQEQYDPVIGVFDWFKASVTANQDTMTAGGFTEALLSISLNEIQDEAFTDLITDKIIEKLSFCSTDQLVRLACAYTFLGDAGYHRGFPMVDHIITEIDANRPWWFFNSWHIADLIWVTLSNPKVHQEFLETLCFELQLPTRNLHPSQELRLFRLFDAVNYYPKAFHLGWFSKTMLVADKYPTDIMTEIVKLHFNQGPKNFLDRAINPIDLRDIIRRIRFCLKEELKTGESSGFTHLGLRTMQQSEQLGNRVLEKTTTNTKVNAFAQPQVFAEMLIACSKAGFLDKSLFGLGIRFVRKYAGLVDHETKGKLFDVYRKMEWSPSEDYALLEISKSTIRGE